MALTNKKVATLINVTKELCQKGLISFFKITTLIKISAGMMCPLLGSMLSKGIKKTERLQDLFERWTKSFTVTDQTRQILITHLKKYI